MTPPFLPPFPPPLRPPPMPEPPKPKPPKPEPPKPDRPNRNRQARNAASACSRSSALLTLRRGRFGRWLTTGVAPLISSTPCRRIRLRLAIRDQFAPRPITHLPHLL